ncbi:MAG: Rrf2 family transcriptional regulator [Bdellovibrionaceae bacterium]|nr:Rrf2 family transcriptional regulator [Pseudobdellovibrionaceae bacterium]
MNRLNKKLEYALMTLQYLHENSANRISTKEVCEKTGSPFDATARVMQIMAQQGLLKSEQGVKGGYLLMRSLAEVTLLELMEMILGPIELAKCLGNSMNCELKGKCNIQSPIHRINQKFKFFLSDLYLSEVLTLTYPKEKVTNVGI